MENENQRFSVTMSSELYEKVTKFRHENLISTQTKAVTQLLEVGISALLQELSGGKIEENKDSTQLSNEDRNLLTAYHRLDEGDQGEIRGEMKQMLKAPKYQTPKKESRNA
jgi:hypothetical protein